MKIKIALLSVLILSAFFGCEEGDGDKDYGLSYIYMPQATVSGGLDNYYNVPSGGGEYTYNFKVQDGKLNVILGVLRSGKLSNEAYSVNVNAFEASSDVLSFVGGVALPASLYTVPQKVDVPANESGETFYLSVDAAALTAGEYDGQKLVVEVEITTPNKFELSDDATSVVVVIDVNKIKEFL